MTINKSAEDYLETILILSKRLPVVRSVDIAAEMNFKKSSISVAMKHLREKGHAIADMIYERHTFLAGWLMALGIDETTATADACRMEHVISPKSFAAIKKYVTESGIKYP